MAIDGIKISFSEVLKTSNTIHTLNVSLTNNLETIKSEMNNLSNSWQSDASSTIRDNFNKLAPKFEDYSKIIESYSKFLEKTVGDYDRVEVANNSSAGQFK